MVLTSFFIGCVHLSRGKSNFETLIYINSDVMCYIPVFLQDQLFACTKTASHQQPLSLK